VSNILPHLNSTLDFVDCSFQCALALPLAQVWHAEHEEEDQDDGEREADAYAEDGGCAESGCE